jgi:hypothetical protein
LSTYILIFLISIHSGIDFPKEQGAPASQRNCDDGKQQNPSPTAISFDWFYLTDPRPCPKRMQKMEDVKASRMGLDSETRDRAGPFQRVNRSAFDRSAFDSSAFDSSESTGASATAMD